MRYMICVLLAGTLFSGCGVKDKVTGMGRGIKKAVTPGRSRRDPRDGKRVYFVTEEFGRRRNSGYSIRKTSTFNGHPCVVVETVKTTELKREKRTFVKTTHRKTFTAVGGAALFSSEVSLAGGERTQETVRIKGGSAVFETSGPGGTHTRKIPVPHGVLFGIDPDWLLARKLQPGATFTAKVLNTSDRKVITEQATVKSRQVEELLGTQINTWTVSTVRENQSPVDMIFTNDGRLVRLETEDIRLRVVTRKEAESSQPLARIVSTVPTSFYLPAWDRFSLFTFELTPAKQWRPFVHNSEYLQAQDNGKEFIVHLTTKIVPGVRRPTLPMKVAKEYQPYLRSAPTILPHKQQIRQLARKIVGRETGVLNAIALLAGWVHQKVRFGQTAALNPSPLATLESFSGDCSEHADLFASLARSLGIPTRHCQGMLLQANSAVYHAWVEALIGTTWVPVDTTKNRVGLPAGYLLTSRGTGNGAPRDEFAWQMRRGNMMMRLISASRKRRNQTSTLIPGKKKTYITVNDNYLTNLYWGFSVELPGNWKGVIKLDGVDLTSPDKQAKAKCEAIPGTYRTTTDDMNRVTASLKKALTGFKQIDARILEFGKRTQQAMLIDFTCNQGGTPLRCRQYIIPKRDRGFRISIWAPADRFADFVPVFNKLVSSFEF